MKNIYLTILDFNNVSLFTIQLTNILKMQFFNLILTNKTVLLYDNFPSKGNKPS